MTRIAADSSIPSWPHLMRPSSRRASARRRDLLLGALDGRVKPGHDERFGAKTAHTRLLAIATLAAALLPGAAFAATEAATIDPFVFRFSIFVIAIFVGYYVVWSVTPALHTPLMSVTNAISSVVIVGAIIAVMTNTTTAASPNDANVTRVLGFVALTMASVNIFGGFLVTARMLAMYKKKEK